MGFEIIGTKHLGPDHRTKAPIFNRINALTGDVADSPVLGILATADHIHDGLAEVDELRTRVQELEAENAELSERLHNLDEAHAITLGLLAKAKNQLAQVTNERDSLRCAVTVGLR